MRFNIFLILIFFTLNALSAGTYFKPPALIEGFTTVVSAAGTTTLTRASQTKLIITGATTQTVVLPDATTMSTELGRRFFIINKSSGTVTVNASGGGLLGTIAGGAQAEVHLRAAGSAAGTWDLLSSSAGGGGTWGSITGTLSAQTDLQSALGLKAPLASPTFSGTITTPLTASRAMVTTAGSALGVSATTATELGYLSGTTSAVQTQLDAKQARSTLTTKGDLYVATASATVARQGVGSDGQVLMSDSTQTNGVKWTTPTSENLIFDGNAESGITNFVEGSYSAATRPAGTFTASSGSGSFAISTSSSSPIFGSNSFLLTKSSGASRQGRAIERTIAIDSGYRTKMLKTRIDYTIVSGTFVAGTNGTSPTDSSLIWYVGQYNGSTWSYTEPSTFKMFSNSTTNSDYVEGEFQVNSDTTQLKLIGFISESANSAWVVKAEVGFRLSNFLAGTTVTDWVAYTPTGSFTNTTYTGKWRRVGDSIEAFVHAIVNNVSGPAPATLSVNYLPSGLTADSTKLNQSNGVIYGYASILDSGSRTYTGSVVYSSASSVRVVHTETGSNGDVSDSAPFTFTINDSISLHLTVPIQGWSSSTQQSDGYDGRFIGARYLSTNSGAWPTSDTVINYATVGYDTTSCVTTGASWNCRVPSAGYYKITAAHAATMSGAGTLSLRIRKNGSAIKTATYPANAATSNISFEVNTTQYFNAGDTIDVVAASTSAIGTYVNDATSNIIVIDKVQAPTTISATEVVAASYTGTSGTITAGGTRFIVDAPTKVYDTHNAVTTGASWKFTAPISGIYTVKYISQHASATYTIGAGLSAELYKNGSFYSILTNSHSQQAATTVGPVLSGSMDVSLNAGDYIDVREAIGGSVAATINSSIIAISKIK